LSISSLSDSTMAPEDNSHKKWSKNLDSTGRSHHGADFSWGKS